MCVYVTTHVHCCNNCSMSQTCLQYYFSIINDFTHHKSSVIFLRTMVEISTQVMLQNGFILIQIFLSFTLFCLHITVKIGSVISYCGNNRVWWEWLLLNCTLNKNLACLSITYQLIKLTNKLYFCLIVWQKIYEERFWTPNYWVFFKS